MSTPCTIFVKIPRELEGTVLQFNQNLLPKNRKTGIPPYGTPGGDFSKLRPVILKKGYLRITVHWNGHLEDNGLELLRNYRSVRQVLNLVSLGCLSSLSSGKPGDETCLVTPYALRKDDDWADVKPVSVKTLRTAVATFNYLFADGEWSFMHLYCKDDPMQGNWQPLTEETVNVYINKYW